MARTTAGREREPHGLLPELESSQPAGHDYVESLRAGVKRLIELEVQAGGDEVAPLAVRSVRDVRHRLEVITHPPNVMAELRAAAGELAEVTAWLLHDADQQDAARQMNLEALRLTRRAGDRSIELLTLANMTFVALFQRQSAEALRISQAVLDGGRLTNRQRVIFKLREARALANLGARVDAMRAADDAMSAFWNGATRKDPDWAWWLDTSEVAGHVGWILLELGETTRGLAVLERAIADAPHGNVSHHFFRLSRHLEALAIAGAWRDAEAIIDELIPYVGAVRSGRARRVLKQSLARIESGRAPAHVVDGARHLGASVSASTRS
jgi:tetratricopeptide (TPR) repeat protein